MRRVCEKLHSRRGASLLYALALLLVTATVSTVVLTSAVTANRRVHDDRQEEQNYLALSSAAKLIVKSLKDSECVVLETVENITDPSPAPPHVPGMTHIKFDKSNSSSGAFGPALEEIVLSFWKDGETSDTITVTVDVGGDSDAGAALGGVTATFTIERGGTPDAGAVGYVSPTIGTYPIHGYLTIGSGTERQQLYLSAYITGSDGTKVSDYNRTISTITETRVVGYDDEGNPIYGSVPIGEEQEWTHTLKWDAISLSTYSQKEADS